MATHHPLPSRNDFVAFEENAGSILFSVPNLPGDACTGDPPRLENADLVYVSGGMYSHLRALYNCHSSFFYGDANSSFWFEPYTDWPTRFSVNCTSCGEWGTPAYSGCMRKYLWDGCVCVCGGAGWVGGPVRLVVCR